MAEVALTHLLEQLKDLQKWYGDLISGSEKEFHELNADLNLLNGFLRNSGNKLNKNEVFMEMERQIREVVYDVEDTIDTILTHAAAAKDKSAFRRSSGSSLLISPAKELNALREDKVKPVLDEVEVRFSALGIADGTGTSAVELPFGPKMDQSMRRDKVVGFEDEERIITSYLMAETKELDVISIIGMPGLGKTTLAWKIFENEEIRFQFPIRIWVNVSQRFNRRDVFLNILRRFTGNHMSGLSDEELASSVRACLAEHTFLIVMDDVWSPEDWKVIQNVLPKSNVLSKVMITSRNVNVGTHANVSRDPHILRFFRLDESWKLLQLEVFGNEDDCPVVLKDIGIKIAHQCYGVPLTVVVVGGILVDLFVKTQVLHRLRNEWENVSENVSKFIQNDKEKRITDVVELSYNRLPDYLRECFLYMAVFPEERVIPAWMLTRLWIAEGFVHPKKGRSLEEAAEEILGDLISRNLLVADQLNPMGEIKTCRVNDMIRGFCRMKALEQNLCQEIKKNKRGVLEPPVTDLPYFHRLCVHSDINEFLSRKPKGPRLRSFLCSYSKTVDLDPRYVSTIPQAFSLLRVLESTSIKYHRFPTKVAGLIHLRYITLNIDVQPTLPEPLSELWNLQTLVVETKSQSITMKANIWKMYRLRHLKMKAAIVLDEEWDGEGGENLQTLSRLAPESCTAKVFERACNLKALGIRGKLANLFSTMSMENSGRLEKLKLMNDLLSEHRITGLPHPKCFPPNLRRLTLSTTFLEWQHISVLSEINTLEALKLKDNAFTGTSWNVGADVFKYLQLLIIINADIVVWAASASNFPALSCLVLKNCEKLENIPGELGDNLDRLDIERLRKSAVDSAKSIEREKRLAQQHQKSKWEVGFKLNIGPGCEK